MWSKITTISTALSLSFITACQPVPADSKNGSAASLDKAAGLTQTTEKKVDGAIGQKKLVVYQVFTRLFGNKNTTNKPWGTIEENGVGKFSDFNEAALEGIRSLGVTHIWYTGVPHHAVINDYGTYGISNDDPDIVKGRAGSPYAVKDYYNVNPDLADDPANRLEEFEQLIARTHAHGMKVVIDIVPNHVARNYQSLSKPEGVSDFGEQDNTQVAYARDNNFYYVPKQAFKVPELTQNSPLGGEQHPLSDGQFDEVPAKWTGNGARAAQPSEHDWYETVKVNYGIRPDGSKDFPTLPEEYRLLGAEAHFRFWQQQVEQNLVPDSWFKFRDIALYWTYKGVDGFRFDMSEMVPVEFWSFLNSSIKMANPNAFLLAEIYNPKVYRDYIELGKMDYLYDKVDFYDSLKKIIQGRGNASELVSIQRKFQDIEANLLHFIDNHDEQRLASPEFAGDMNKGKPALVVSSLISRSPMMIYFGLEVGEDGSEETGFGDPSRTTIFDYAGVPAHQRWMNGGKFDGGALTNDEAALRDYYQKVLNFAVKNEAIRGQYLDLHQWNIEHTHGYSQQQIGFARWSKNSKVLVLSNFNDDAELKFQFSVSNKLLDLWSLVDGEYEFIDQLSGQSYILTVAQGQAKMPVTLAPLQSLILKFKGEVNANLHYASNTQSSLLKQSKHNKRSTMGKDVGFKNEQVQGQVIILENAIHLPSLNRDRTLRIYLPPLYAQNSDKRYPVIYMHDGQNLFDAKTSFAGEWQVDETLDELYRSYGFEAIVVGIDNGESERLHEYSAWSHEKYGRGDGDKFMSDLVQVIKPFIDDNYRTLKDKSNTAMIGSSLGSLISHYAGVKYNTVFGKLGLFSTSYWYAPAIYEFTKAQQALSGRWYFMAGDKESADMVIDQKRMTELLDSPAYSQLFISESVVAGGQHNEKLWREELATSIKWLFAIN